jgi:hypothetical protein
MNCISLEAKVPGEFLGLRCEMTISDAKDVLRVSRKFACGVLKYLDKIQTRPGQPEVEDARKKLEGLQN